MVETILGTAQMVQPYGRLSHGKAPSHAQAIELLQQAHDRGVRVIDTAPSYGDAEQVIGASKLDFAVHTKILPGLPAPVSLERSLRDLRRDSVEVLYLHDPSELLNPAGTTVAEAYELVGTSVAALGVSTYHPEEFDAAVRDPRITVVQVPLNVLDRRIDDDQLRLACDAGMRIVARSAYLQGLLVCPLEDVRRVMPQLFDAVAEFRKVVDALGRTDKELALGWVVARPGLYGCTVGVDTQRRLDELVEAMASRLTAEELAALQGIHAAPEALLDPRTWP